MWTTRLRRGALAALLAAALGGCSAAAIDQDFAAPAPGDRTIRIADAGIAGLPPDLAYAAAAVEGALPGFDAMAVTMSTETEARDALALFRNGRQVMQVLPGSGSGIGAVHGVGADVRGPNGERIGMTLRETGLGRAACREGRGNWQGMPICTVPNARTVSLVFTIPGHQGAAGLPDDPVLGTATLQRIIWTAEGTAS